MVGPGLIDGSHCGLEVRPCLEGNRAKLREGRNLVGKVEGSRHVELFDGRPVIQQHQKLDLCRAQVDRGGLQVGFILDALQLQAVQVDARDIPCLESFATQIKHVVVIGKVLLSQCQNCLLLEDLYKRAPQGEEETSFLVRQLRDGDGCSLLRALPPQIPLVHTLEQIA